MRLRRVEAVRYGSLADATLGDLGDGLTVVHGPNEAGKSTFTSLVRHVLYGFPTQRDRDAGYFVDGAGRLARLVFEGEDGSWVVERSEGAHGGGVRVRVLAGAERPNLLSDLTRGVSPLAYRMVFGFGLDEMPRIEELRGSEDDIIARLYAAGAGLRVSPQEVRAALDREAAEIFKPRGRTPEINTLVAQARETRAELRRLRAEAESFRADQQRLDVLRTELAGARKRRDDARSRATDLAIAVERAEERLGVIAAQEEALLELRRQRMRLSEEREGIVPDEELLAASAELDALVEEGVRHDRTRQAIADGQGALARAEARVADVVSRSGVAADALAALSASEESGVAIEEAREDLQRLGLQSEAREETAERVRGAYERARQAADRSLGLAGLDELSAEDASCGDLIADRLAALEAIEALRGESAVGGGRVDAPALIMLGSGVLSALAGAVLREWTAVGIGVLLTGAGVWFVLRARSGRPSLSTGERDFLEVLGLHASPGTVEIARMRRSLENARQAVSAAEDARERLREAEADAALAGNALAARYALWSEWLLGKGIDPGLSPAVASGVVALAREARVAESGVETERAELERLTEAADAFAQRFAAVARPYLPGLGAVTRDDVPALGNQLKALLAAARTAAGRREELDREITGLDSRIASEGDRAARARDDLREILARFGLAEQGSHADLRILHATALRAESEADETFETLTREATQLEARLASEARERRGGELHLAEAGIKQRIAEAADRYITLSGAALLLGRAQERYERERQPEVVRQAERLFATMTEGRYPALSIPLGDGSIEVFDTHAAAKTSSLLSRGTAEQLYLALRLGLIAQLGETGHGLPVLMDDVLVNFDPGRKRGAAEAIAELASERQVVFFTCHPETVSLFAEVAPAHTRVELARAGAC